MIVAVIIRLTVCINLLLSGFAWQTKCHHYIGLHKSEIVDMVKTRDPDFHLDNTTRNTVYNYLKFVEKNTNFEKSF